MRRAKEIDTQKLINAYLGGATVKQLQREFDISRSGIYNRLNAAGVPLRTQRLHEGNIGCPFFLAHSFAGVKCDAGKGEWRSLFIGFPGVEQNESYRKRRCMGEYKKCALFRLFSECNE